MELKSVNVEKKLMRKDFLEEIKKASSEKYETNWDDEGRIGEQKKKSKIRLGSKARASGGQFELRVRKDLEEKGWIVDKWSNNIEFGGDKNAFNKGVLVRCRPKFNPFTKRLIMNTGGFPDFLAFQLMDGGKYKIIGVEVKINGTLSRIEKEKCRWYLDNKIFNEILVARKVKEKNRVHVEYLDVKGILKRMR